jgi:signal transduction histidine kinase
MRWRHAGVTGRSRLWLVTETFERLTIRGAFFVGFGLILGLWLVSGAGLLRGVVEVEKRTSDVQARFMHAEDLLSTVRTQILLGSVYLRDALLDTPDTAGYYRGQLQAVRTAIDQALTKYVPVIDSQGERQTFAQLGAEIQDFWDTVIPAVSWDTARRATEARALLREVVIPRRQVIIEISDRVQRLNRAAFDEQQAEVGRIHVAMRRRVWETSAEVLLLGIGVAFFVIRYAGRLEGRIQKQRLREQETARNLQRLSARLVRAQEEERRSIARELHDEIGQALTAIKVELAVAERTLEPEASTRSALGEARSITDHALQTVRDLSQLLHPPLLDDLGLRATLDWYLRSFSKRTGIAADLVQQGTEERLAPEVETCLYRIAQEALTNVAKHAEATACRIYLQRLPQTVLLTVEDDGKGFEVQEVTSPQARRGLGLLGVQERVAGFGGEFRLESSPGKGTRLTVELPALPREQTEAKTGPDVERAPDAVRSEEVS